MSAVVSGLGLGLPGSLEERPQMLRSLLRAVMSDLGRRVGESVERLRVWRGLGFLADDGEVAVVVVVEVVEVLEVWVLRKNDWAEEVVVVGVFSSLGLGELGTADPGDEGDVSSG